MGGLLLSALSLHAFTEGQTINDGRRAKLQKEGFNPEGGVTLVPMEQLSAPDDLKQEWLVQQKEQQENGYHSTYSERAQELLQMEETSYFKIKAHANNKNADSSLLRKHLSDIHMAYQFTPVPRAKDITVYGFAASNTFQHGWTGIVEFFKKKGLGNCAYTENNVTLSHAAAKVDEAVARYDINHKVTTLNVEGNEQSGYVYTVDWMDARFFRTLECATRHYSKDKTDEVIILAQRLDNASP